MSFVIADQASAEEDPEVTEEVALVRKRAKTPSKETEDTSSQIHDPQGPDPVEPPKSKSLTTICYFLFFVFKPY